MAEPIVKERLGAYELVPPRFLRCTVILVYSEK